MHSEKSPSFLQAFLDFLWSPFRTIKHFYADLAQVDERLRDDSIAVRMVAIIATPFRLLGGFISMMVQNWPTSRSGAAAIAGLPAFFTLLGLLGAWVLTDYIRNEAWRVRTNQAYYDLNVQARSDTPESALTYARKLVEIDPNDTKLKYQLGVAEMRAGNPIAANDAMTSIAPENPEDDKAGLPIAHVWRSSYLVQNKSAEEFKEVIGQAEKHLQLAIDANKENLAGKSQLAYLYMNYANLLEERAPERLEYLEKADETFREIIEDDTVLQSNSTTQILTLSPSTLVRKQLEALAPEKYSLDDEVERVRSSVVNFRRLASRRKLQEIQLWLILINSASEIRDFDLAVEIADQALKIVESPRSQQGLAKAKSLALRKAAMTINNFDDFESYRDRFGYLCEAARAAPADPAAYVLLLQYVGRENPKPNMQIARQLGLSSPGDAVPIKPEWLYRLCVEAKYTGLATAMIGLEEFHLGNNEIGFKSWSVAQQFDISTREFIARLLEVVLLSKNDKLDNLDTILSEALLVYPEAVRIRMLRGLWSTREKKFQAAIDDFRIVLNFMPNDLLLHQRIKSCYLFLGQRAAAADEQKIIDTKLKRMSQDDQVRMQRMFEKLEEGQAATP